MRVEGVERRREPGLSAALRRRIRAAKKPKPEPIRVGDKFASRAGAVWEVDATKPGGVVDLWDAERYRSMRTYTRCIRAWLGAGTHWRVGLLDKSLEGFEL